MDVMFVIHSDPTTAQTRADALKLARLQEVWGGAYDGQVVWPDQVTVRAVDVTELTDGRAAFPVDPRHERHYTATERENKRERIDDLLPEVEVLRR